MANAKVIISSEDRLSQGLNSAKKSMMQFQQGVQKVGNTLKTAFNVAVIAVAVKKIGDAVSDCTKQFLEMERKYKQLRFTLGNGEAFKSVTDNISKLAKITLSSKGDIESMVSELAGLGRSADEINAISEAAVNLSNVTGQSLNSAMTTLLNTYNGNTKALNKLGIETKQFSKTELEAGAAVNLVNEKFGELSKSMAEADTSQHIKNIKDTFGDIKQAIGEVVNLNIAPIVANIDTELTGMFEKIVSYVDYIGATIMNFPTVLSLVGTTITKMIERLFTWDTLKSGITRIVTFMGNAIVNMADIIANLVDNLITAIIAEIQYLAASLYSELVGAILKAIGTSEEEFANSTLGKVLNLGNKVKGVAQIGLALATNSPSSYAKGELSPMSQGIAKSAANNLLGGADPATTAKILKETADKAFENVGTSLINSFKTLFSYGEDALQGIASFASDNFGDIFSEFMENLDAIVAPTLEIIENARKERQSTDGNVPRRKKEDEEEEANFGKGVLSAFTSAMGDAGKAIGDIVSNISTYGAKAGVALSAFTYAFEGMAPVIGESLNKFMETVIAPFKALGETVGQFLLPLIDELVKGFGPIATSLTQMFAMLETSLGPVINSITHVLSPVLKVIGAILEALMPIIKVFAKVFVTITGTIEYVIQTLQHWVASLMNWLAGLNIFGWHPFGGLAMEDPGAPGRYRDYIGNKWASIDAAFEAASSPSGTATGTTVSSAGYQGATQITINIYQEAPVVGDGGMREFAQMIKDEFDNLNYYGVTA